MAAPSGGAQFRAAPSGAQFHAPTASAGTQFHTPAVSGQSAIHTPGVTAGAATPGVTAGAAVPHVNAAPHMNPTISGATTAGANAGLNAGAHTAMRPTFGANAATGANVGANATANNFRANWHTAPATQLQGVHSNLSTALRANTAALRANTAATTAANTARTNAAATTTANVAGNNATANLAGFTNPARASYWNNIGAGLTNSLLFGNPYGAYGGYGLGGYGLGGYGYGGYPMFGGNFWSGRNLIGMGVMSALGGGYGGYGVGGYGLGGVGGYGGLGNWWGYSPWMGSYPAGYWYGNPGWGTFANTYGSPYFYDYGPGGNVVYSGNQVLVNDQPVATAADYAQSAAQLATVTEDEMKAPHDWVPLGTFSVATSAEDKNPTRAAQIAYDNKQGLISGTIFNSKSGNLYTLQGKVDPQTQRVAFTVGNDPNTVFETGLYNLTQNATPVLLHQGPTQTQTWVFARLPEPKEDQATTTAAAPQQPAPIGTPPAEDLRRE